MEDFESLKVELELIAFENGKNGTLYYPKDTFNRILVRHFDGDIPVDFIPIYAQVVEELQRFIDNNSILSNLIKVIQLDEVGIDFIIRERFRYVQCIHSYFRNDEDYIAPPPRFYTVKQELEKLENSELQAQDAILVKILVKSFIRSSYKTVPDWNKFINYSPNMNMTDLKEWNAAIKANC